jgi:diguanylate cyclase (GGDEF)-like protein
MEIEQRLSAVLSEFARTMATDSPIQAILDHLVLRIVDVVPVTAAGVTLISPDCAPGYVAASDASALGFERLQMELGDGPCLLASRSGQTVAVTDLQVDRQFPGFACRAEALGLRAVFTFPLRHGNHLLGALDLYRNTPGPLDRAAMSAAQTLADVTAAYLLNARARADLEDASEHARQASLHDPLTGLPNRSLLVERLEHAILRCRRSEKLVAILYADLDGFKSINDTYGHQTGDDLLVAVAERLTGLLRPDDTLARMSGDEFVILCEDLDGVAQVEPIVARIALALKGSFDLSGTRVQVSASVGIAFSGRGDDVPEQILREADTAMYQAKRKGGGHHAFIGLRDHHLMQDRDSLARDLRGALCNGELRVAYQPIVAFLDGRVLGVEALLRWHHPTLGEVPPQTTVELAEKSGLIDEIGRWVMVQACRDRQRWAGVAGARCSGISINVSAHQLLAPDFAATVGTVLLETQTDPANVTLELTESLFIGDGAGVVDVLHDLKRLGLRLALDDFGTGYSSLSYLTRLPVDTVKIDRAFIAALGSEPRNHVIAGAIVELAHALHLEVVAEGVESPRQFEQVRDLNCDAYQGFHFARPVSAAVLAASRPLSMGAC